MLVTILIFLLILTLLVVIHEAGHYFVARLFNIKVEEFGFGFPPRAWGKKIGETIYSINWLPIGGFVKLYGEDEAGGGKISISKDKKYKDVARAFFAKSALQRAVVVAAGVVMNFLLAVVIISFLFAVVGVGVPGNKVVVSQIANNSPAQTAGLKTGDIIEYIDNTKITSTDQIIQETKKHLGEVLTLKISSDNVEKEIKLTPRVKYPAGEGPMGVAISQSVTVKKYPWYEAPIVGTQEALRTSWLIVSSFGTVAVQVFTQGSVPKDVAGPVGVAQLTGQVVQVGPMAVLSFISLLSLNLAIVNILPIPALDGGRLFFILFELVSRRKVHPRFETYAHTIGMVLLLALILLITLHDISRLLSGQSILPSR